MHRIHFLSLIAVLSACQEAPPAPASEAVASDPVVSTCGGLGELRGALSGAINTELAWNDAALRCESMPRPDARGVRIRMSGEVGGERLAIIIALPTLEPELTGTDFDAVVTVTVDGSGRFFSTPNLGSCWARIDSNAPLEDAPGTYNVVGSLSCVAPLGEFNGDAFIDVHDLAFSGIANWNKS